MWLMMIAAMWATLVVTGLAVFWYEARHAVPDPEDVEVE